MLISRECALYLNENNSLQLLRYQALSGLGFNKLGSYTECISDPDSQFYLFSGSTDLLNLAELEFMSGLCFSKKCSASDLTYALGSLQQYIGLPFRLISVETPSLQQQSLDAGSRTVLIMLGLLVSFFLTCSIIDLINKARNKCSNNKLLQIFSIVTTLRLLGWVKNKTEQKRQRVKVFSGIKALSLAGLFMVNLGIVAYSAPTTSAYSRNAAGSLLACFYAVDVWLMVSGFFLSYLLMKQYHKSHRIDIVLFKIVRRFTRLWPIYAISFALNWFVVPIAGSGPIWPLLADYPRKYCGSLLPHLFMVSNYTDSECYNWLWPLQLDFQLCVLFVPLLVLYLKCRSVWASIIFFGIQIVFLLTSILSPVILEGAPSPDLTAYFFHKEYATPNILPFVRSGGYLVGYNLGILFHQFKKAHDKHELLMIKLLNRKWVRIACVVIGLGGLLVVGIWFSFVGVHVQSQKQQGLDITAQVGLSALRTLVPFLVVLMAIPGLFGYQQPIKSMFQSSACDFVSKLSLPLYCMSFTSAIYIIYKRQSDLELSNFTLIYLTLCSVIPSVMMALVLTTIVEIPVFVVKKMYWKTKRITYFQH